MDQWELDLRKQLEGANSGGTTTKPPIQTPKPQPQPQNLPRRRPQPKLAKPAPAPSKGGSSPALLIVTISLLGLLLLAVNTKTNESLFRWPSLNASKPIVVEPKPELNLDEPPQPEAVDYSATISQLVQDVEALQAKDQSIDEKLALQARRTAFLGMLHNNNFVIMKNGYNRNDLVFLNRDWSIDQMPKYLTLTAEDRAYLERYLHRE